MSLLGIFLFFYCFLLSSCGENRERSALYINLTENDVYVQKGWTGADIKGEALGNDTNWQKYDLKGKNHFRFYDFDPSLKNNTDIGEYTYCFPFSLSEAKWNLIVKSAGESPCLYIPRMGDNWAVYLNGNLIRSYVHLDSKGGILKHKSLVNIELPVSPSFFKQGLNLMTFRVIGHNNSIFTGLDFVSGMCIEDYFIVENWNNKAVQYVILGFFLMIGVFYLAAFVARRKDIFNLYYGLMAICASISYAMQFTGTTSFIGNTSISTRIEYMTFLFMLVFMAAFFDQVNWHKVHLPVKIVLGFSLVLSIVTATIDFRYLGPVLTLCYYGGFACGIYILLVDILYALIKFSRKNGFWQTIKTTTMGNLLLPTLFEFGSYIYISVHRTLNNIGLPISFISLTVFIGAGGIILIKDYVNSVGNLETSVRKRTAELERQTKIAEEQSQIAIEASRAKSDFLARMSHDIRTPLNAILGMIKLAIRRNPPKDFYEDALTIQSEGNNLLNIVNDILDFSKIESGKLQIVNEVYDLASMLNNTIDIINNRADEKSLDFIVDTDSKLPSKLKGDANKIMQILTNVLGNAVKYTEKGSVRLEVGGQLNETENKITLHFVTRDTGIGIREEDKAMLFKDFTRLDMENNKNITGTGLGLVIASSFAKAMGGGIEAESVYGKGSTFTVNIVQEVIDKNPIGLVTNGKITRTVDNHDELLNTHISAPEAHVLIVDDVPTNLKVAEGMIHIFDVQTESATSADEAIEKVKANSLKEKAEQYDIFFMDQMMPENDGIEATEELRALGFSDIPIIALTANAIEGTRESLLSKGFNDYVSKPIDFNQLNTIMRKWLPREKIG
jgi:signal transduction histidine kinase/CheY-like chemotaxis protein